MYIYLYIYIYIYIYILYIYTPAYDHHNYIQYIYIYIYIYIYHIYGDHKRVFLLYMTTEKQLQHCLVSYTQCIIAIFVMSQCTYKYHKVADFQ